jgi:hypothetical protein
VPLRRYLSAVLAIAALVWLVIRTRAERSAQRGVVIPASVTASSVRSCGDPIIRDNGIGKLRIGMRADSVNSICQVALDTVRPGPEGMSQRVMMVAFPPDAVEAEIVNDSVWRLDVRTPGIRTTDSLGVGTPIAELLKHGDARGMIGEGNFVLIYRNRCGISFILSGGIPPGRPRVWNAKELAKLDPVTKVERILVYDCALRPSFTPS